MAAGLVVHLALVDADAITTAVQHWGQVPVYRANSPYGRLVVTEDAGQLTFFENGLPVISTQNVGQVEETVHYAMSQRPEAKRVLLIGGGVAGTAREILRYGVEHLTYVEIDPQIIAAGRRFLPDNLADPRIETVAADGRRFVQETRERFEVVIIDMPDPSTLQLNRFFTSGFFGEVRRVLAPGGFFLAKVLQGGSEGELLARLKRDFAVVRHLKPKASRADSAKSTATTAARPCS